MKNSIIEIRNKKILYALIIKKKRRFIKKGVDFITKIRFITIRIY